MCLLGQVICWKLLIATFGQRGGVNFGVGEGTAARLELECIQYARFFLFFFSCVGYRRRVKTVLPRHCSEWDRFSCVSFVANKKGLPCGVRRDAVQKFLRMGRLYSWRRLLIGRGVGGGEGECVETWTDFWEGGAWKRCCEGFLGIFSLLKIVFGGMLQ